MTYPDEYDVLLFFKDTLDTLINTNKAIVSGWGNLTDVAEKALEQSDKLILATSRMQVLIDPDALFAIQDVNTNKSTPVLLIGIADTDPTLNSVQGNMVYGENSFDFICIVAKANRVFQDWFREISAIKKFLLDGFIASTNKRIFVGSIHWSDYIVGDIPGSGFTMKIKTSINNYDYQIT